MWGDNTYGNVIKKDFGSISAPGTSVDLGGGIISYCDFSVFYVKITVNGETYLDEVDLQSGGNEEVYNLELTLPTPTPTNTFTSTPTFTSTRAPTIDFKIEGSGVMFKKNGGS